MVLTDQLLNFLQQIARLGVIRVSEQGQIDIGHLDRVHDGNNGDRRTETGVLIAAMNDFGRR